MTFRKLIFESLSNIVCLEVVPDPGCVPVHPGVHPGEVWPAALHSEARDAYDTPPAAHSELRARVIIWV